MVMSVIIDFLTDAAKIIFGSAVVGFFIPGVAGEVNRMILFGGITTTAVFLSIAVALSERIKES